MTIPVSVSGFTWTAGLVGVLNVLVGSLLVAIVRTRPALQEIANKREVTALEARGEDMEDMRARIATLEGRIENAVQAAHQAELKLVSALAAYRLIASELLKHDPENPILKQAQELLNVSYPTPRGPVADSIREGAST